MIRQHPAKYSESLMPVLARILSTRKRILDPMAGSGKVFELRNSLPDAQIFAGEIEPEWAIMSEAMVANALHMPWASGVFDAVVTSPTYGNRMADHHNARDGSRRITYTHVLGRKLHTDNSGAMQWGSEYRHFHRMVWAEVYRVLARRGIFVLNCKDHYRGGILQEVTKWHISAVEALGFRTRYHELVQCPGMRFGENHQSRVDYESVIVFLK
jgi:hypothetical protein